MSQVKNWYLVHCKPHQDKRAEHNLTSQGYICVRPTYKQERLIQGRLLVVEESLFPGYLFIQITENSSWVPLRSTRGVSRIVCFGGSPLAVSDEIVSHFLLCTAVGTKKYLQAGDSVRISEGELSGIEAIFESMDGDERVVILIDFLSRRQRVILPLAAVKKY